MSGNGPVSVNVLKRLMSEGHLVFMVSASPFCAGLDVPKFNPVGARSEVLKRLRARVNADRYVYVGDTVGDLGAAKRASYEFIYANNFIDWLESELDVVW